MNRELPSNWRLFGLTTNFVLGEFVVSYDHGPLLNNFIPSTYQVSNIGTLCRLALQPARDLYGTFNITSGIVTPELNLARGGVASSQHLYGEACDFVPKNTPALTVYMHFKDVVKWPGQLFFYAKKGHIHIALPNPWVAPSTKIIV